MTWTHGSMRCAAELRAPRRRPSLHPAAHDGARAWAGCSRTRLPRRSATSAASPAPRSWSGTPGSVPLVRQSGGRDVRGPLAKNGPKYLRWALIEAATHAARDPRYMRALRAHEATPRPPARREGRPGRPRPPARRSHLARPHEARTVRPGRPRDRSGRLTTLHGIGPPAQPPIRPCPSVKRRR